MCKISKLCEPVWIWPKPCVFINGNNTHTRTEQLGPRRLRWIFQSQAQLGSVRFWIGTIMMDGVFANIQFSLHSLDTLLWRNVILGKTQNGQLGKIQLVVNKCPVGWQDLKSSKNLFNTVMCTSFQIFGRNS